MDEQSDLRSLIAVIELLNECVRESTQVQSVICSKKTFSSADAARGWVKQHGFKTSKMDETGTSYRFRQFEPSSCQDGSFRTITLTEGVSATICKPK